MFLHILSVTGNNLLRRSPLNTIRQKNNGQHFLLNGKNTEIWHYFIAPNLRFYLLKPAHLKGYNEFRTQEIDWPVIPHFQLRLKPARRGSNCEIRIRYLRKNKVFEMKEV